MSSLSKECFVFYLSEPFQGKEKPKRDVLGTEEKPWTLSKSEESGDKSDPTQEVDDTLENLTESYLKGYIETPEEEAELLERFIDILNNNKQGEQKKLINIITKDIDRFIAINDKINKSNDNFKLDEKPLDLKPLDLKFGAKILEILNKSTTTTDLASNRMASTKFTALPLGMRAGANRGGRKTNKRKRKRNKKTKRKRNKKTKKTKRNKKYNGKGGAQQLPAIPTAQAQAQDILRALRAARKIFLLPPNWERMANAHGKIYYVDHNTGTTTWNNPELPPNWEEKVKNDGESVYYVNHNTNTNTWRKPPKPVETEVCGHVTPNGKCLRKKPIGDRYCKMHTCPENKVNCLSFKRSSETMCEKCKDTTVNTNELSNDYRRVILVITPSGEGSSEKMVLKYTTNNNYIKPYETEATNYNAIHASGYETDVLKIHGSGQTYDDPDPYLRKFSFDETKFFKLRFNKTTDFFLLLEFDPNNYTLEKLWNKSDQFGQQPSPEKVNLNKKYLQLIWTSLCKLHSKHNFTHADFKSDNVLIHVPPLEVGHITTPTVKNFDFDQSFIGFPKRGDVPLQYYPNWFRIYPEDTSNSDNTKKILLLLLDLWRLYCYIFKFDLKAWNEKYVDIKIYCFSKNITMKDFHEFDIDILKHFQSPSVFNRHWNEFYMSYDVVKRLYDYINASMDERMAMYFHEIDKK
jgi:hypothetical protein